MSFSRELYSFCILATYFEQFCKIYLGIIRLACAVILLKIENFGVIEYL